MKIDNIYTNVYIIKDIFIYNDFKLFGIKIYFYIKLIKTFLRNSMPRERSSEISMISIESNILVKVI